MNLIEKAQMQHFHRERIKQFGDLTAEALGWRNEHSQQKRFEILIQIADLSGQVVLDLGCGYGDLKPFLDEHFEGFTYIGADYMPDFIEKAKNKYGAHDRTYFVEGDFSKMQFEGADYILASGVFCYPSQDEHYYWETIKHMVYAARKGAAFNMLDEQRASPQPLLKTHDRFKVLEFCRELCENVELIDGYLEDDFTIFVRKQ